VPITYSSGEQIEVYRFSIPVTVGVPLLALFLQAFLPRRFPFFSIFDLPLLVTIFLPWRAAIRSRAFLLEHPSAWRRICWGLIPLESTASP